MVYAFSSEEGYFGGWGSSDTFSKTGKNLGVNCIIGISSPYVKKISVDLGFQIGKVIVDNLTSYKSYMPGMGIKFGDINLQGILRMKYRIN